MSEEDWIQLLTQEREQRPSSLPDRRPSASDLRNWWRTISEILEVAEAMPDRPVPREILKILSRLSYDLSVGHVSELFSDVTAGIRGQKAPSWLEKAHIEIAVAYRDAVSRGLLKDRRPVQTIANAYGLANRTTVQQWCREFRPRQFKSDAEAAEMLPQLLISNGLAYGDRNTRTVGAIQRKARKRLPK